MRGKRTISVICALSLVASLVLSVPMTSAFADDESLSSAAEESGLPAAAEDGGAGAAAIEEAPAQEANAVPDEPAAALGGSFEALASGSFEALATTVSNPVVYSVNANGQDAADGLVNYVLLEVNDNDWDDVTYLLGGNQASPSLVSSSTVGADTTATRIKLSVPAELSGAAVTLTTSGAESDLNTTVNIPVAGVQAPVTLYGTTRMAFSEYFHEFTADNYAGITAEQPSQTSFDTAATVRTPAPFIAQGTRNSKATNPNAADVTWATSKNYPAVDTISSATFGDSVHFIPSGALELNYLADIYTQGPDHAITGITAVEVGVNFDLYANAALLAQASVPTAQSAAVLAKVAAITPAPAESIYKPKYLFPDATWGARQATPISNSGIDTFPAFRASTQTSLNPSISYGGNWSIRMVDVVFDGLSATPEYWDDYFEYIYGGYVENKTTGARQPLVWLQNIFSHRMHNNLDISVNENLFTRFGSLGFPDNFKIVIFAEGFEDIVVDDVFLKTYANGGAFIEQGTTFYVDPDDEETWFERTDSPTSELHIKGADVATISDIDNDTVTPVLKKGATVISDVSFEANVGDQEIALIVPDSFFTGSFQGAYTIMLAPDDATTAHKPLSLVVNKLVAWPKLSIEGGAQADADSQADALEVAQGKTVSIDNDALAQSLVTSGRSFSSVVDLTDVGATVVLGDVLKRASGNEPYYIDTAGLTVGHSYRLNLITTNYAVRTAPDTYTTTLVYYLDVVASGSPVKTVPYGQSITIGTALSNARALDILAGSSAVGASVVLGAGQGASSQRFELIAAPDGFFYIQNARSDMVLAVDGPLATPGTAVVQRPLRLGNTSQLWTAEPVSNGFLLKSALGSDLYLDVYGASAAAGARLIVYGRHGEANQVFTFDVVAQTVPDGTYVIQSFGTTNRVLDIQGASSAAGARLILWGSHGGANQSFTLNFDPATGYYTISTHAGKVLDIEGASTKNGAALIQWPGRNANNENQLWSIVGNDADGYIIQSALNGSVLDLYGASVTEGNRIISWPQHGGANQRWEFLS
jgi:hypothetical protein